jgi:hypothetical protein
MSVLVLLLVAPASRLLAQQGTRSIGIEGGPGLSLIYGSEGVYGSSDPALSGAAGITGEYGFAGHFSAKVALHYERISTITDSQSALLPAGGNKLPVRWQQGPAVHPQRSGFSIPPQISGQLGY